MNSQKQENLLSLALDSTVEEREKSQILNVGVDSETNRWEVIVKYHGNIERIANDEVQVEILIAGYAIVTLPAYLLEALSELEEIEYIEKPKSLVYGLYEAKSESCVLSLNTSGIEVSGKGVMVAVIDSGIDYFLEDFQNEAGTRIQFLWDQSLEADFREEWKAPEGFTIGVEFTKKQIDFALKTGSRQEALKLVPSQDFSGHGTAVAAIAASSNSEILLRGVAYESDLLIVKLKSAKDSGFPSTTQIMRGVTYAIRKSLEVNRPLVINLSFGNSYGSHDGSSLLERFLDNASEIGRTCICVGAGNEGSSGGHYAGNVKEVQQVELAIDEREETVNVQLWKSYEDVFTITLISPNQQKYEIETGIFPLRKEFIFKQTKILVYTGVSTPYSTKQEIFFAFLPLKEYINSGIWRWELQAEKVVDGNFQMYLPPSVQRNPGTRFFLQTPELTMTIPATSQRVISVAAYNDTLDSYADFSGRGRQKGFSYLAAEGTKPDIAAPGVGILAAKAGGGTDSYTGTSFSTPLVAGSAALLMEWGVIQKKDSYLYGEKIKSYLRKGAKPIRGEEDYPNEKVGWGALCLKNSFPQDSF